MFVCEMQESNKVARVESRTHKTQESNTLRYKVLRTLRMEPAIIGYVGGVKVSCVLFFFSKTK